MYKIGDYIVGQRYDKRYYVGIVVDNENTYSIETIDRNMKRYRYDKSKIRHATPDEISAFKKGDYYGFICIYTN